MVGSLLVSSSARRGALVLITVLALGVTAYLVGRSPSPTVPAPAAPARPSGPAPPSARTGWIEVTSSVAGAAVTVDGKPLGPAPQRAEGLAGGPHRVRVEKGGYPPFDQEVHVIPGHATKVEARFRGEVPPLRVDSDVPGASVFLDRRYVGRTPVEIGDLAPGPHQLNVSAEGYEPHLETIETPHDVTVLFKEVRLDASVAVVHKHGIGSCQGTLRATTAGLRYDSPRREDTFTAAFAQVERFEVDYLKKTLRVSLRGGRSYNFTGDADALLTFHKQVDAARKRL